MDNNAKLKARAGVHIYNERHVCSRPAVRCQVIKVYIYPRGRGGLSVVSWMLGLGGVGSDILNTGGNKRRHTVVNKNWSVKKK